MKKLNRIISIILVAAMLFVQVPVVQAAGSATITLTASNNNPTVGGTVDVTVGLSNITNATNGVMGFQASVSYDNNILEIDEANQTPLAINASYSDSVKTIAALAFNPATYIKTTSSGVIKLRFKVKAAGSATIRITNPEITAGNNEILSSAAASITLNATVPVPKSTNAYLKSLSITGYTFNETFNKDTLSYSVTVPHTVSTVTINAQAEDSKAKSVSNTGNKTLSAAGQKSTFSITVTAEDGTTKKTYVVNINREAAPVVPKSSDNTLKDLSVDGYTMSPAFSSGVLNYTVTVPHDATEVMINADKNDSKAKVEVIGNTNLSVGENDVQVKVTAEDGSVKVYTVKVTRKEEEKEPVVELDGDATLKKLDISGYTLSPKFDKNTNVYSINVGEKVTGLNVDALATSDKAKVEIKGNNGWQYGVNSVMIVVTAENGNKNTYIINVNRKSPDNKVVTKSSNNYLKKLTIGGADLKPGFDKDYGNYTITVPYDVSILDIDAVLEDSKAKIEILGNKQLPVGEVSTVQVKVTAEDGSVRFYTINATRSSKTSNAYLKELSAKGFVLSPLFDKDVTKYNMDVKWNTKSLDLTAIGATDDVTVEVIGNEDFQYGKNTVLIKVTDENGFNKIYQIDVNKPRMMIFGLPLFQFIMWLLTVSGILVLGLLLLSLLKKRRHTAPLVNQTITNPVPQSQATPVIEFKPEFNFSSKNGTDDDVVYQGTLNQGNGAIPMNDSKKRLIEEAHYEELEDTGNIFDETVTKTELIQAIREGMETKNVDKLRMLLKQDELNRLKKKVKDQETNQYGSERY